MNYLSKSYPKARSSQHRSESYAANTSARYSARQILRRFDSGKTASHPADSASAPRHLVALCDLSRYAKPALCGLMAILMTGCPGAENKPCKVDSDCQAGLWCHPTEQICMAVTCEGTQCQVPGDAPASDTVSDAVADTNQPDVQAEPDTSSDTTTSNDGTTPPDSTDQTDTSSCTTPTSWSYRITGLAIGNDGSSGKGLNIDNDSGTCAPKATCSDGIDNGFAGVSGLAADALTQAVDAETIRLVLRRQGCGPIELLTYTKDGSTRHIDAASIDSKTGYGKSFVPNVVFDSPSFSAGPDGEFAFPLAVAGAQTIIPIHGVHVEGAIRGNDISIVLGGIVDHGELENSLTELAKGMGLEPKTVFDLVFGLTEIDQDTDNDGDNDSISIGLILTGSTAVLNEP